MTHTIPSLFLEFVDRAPSEVGVRYTKHGAWMSLRREELLTQVASLAAGLHKLGVAPGVPVAILAPTCPEWTALDLATLSLGGLVVGIYPTLATNALVYQLQHSEAAVLIAQDAAQIRKLDSRAVDLPHLKHILTIDPDPGQTSIQALNEPHDVEWLRAEIAKRTPDELATLIYTSGTTGDPKGVELTHDNFVQTAIASQVIPGIGRGESTVVFLPLAHSFQRFTGYRGFLEEGVGWYAPSIEALPQAILDAQPTVLTTVPRMLEKIHAKANATVARRPVWAQEVYHWALNIGRVRAEMVVGNKPIPIKLKIQYWLAELIVFKKIKKQLGGHLKLVVSGGAALNPEVAWWFLSIGVMVLEGWGLTETSAPATGNTIGKMKVGTVGHPLPGIEIKLADDGEVLVRGPGVFRGYYRNDAATAEAFEGDWFKTGDIGEIDEDGFLKIVDRKKEIIITAGGKNIPPLNIESLIEMSPLIETAVVIGDGRPYLTALIVPDESVLRARFSDSDTPFQSMAQQPDIIARIQKEIAVKTKELARFEKIKRFTLIPRSLSEDLDELTPTLKLKRRVISETWKREIEEMYR